MPLQKLALYHTFERKHCLVEGASWQRSESGDFLYRLKYGGDRTAVPYLAERLAQLCGRNLPVAKVDFIVPVPPSSQRDYDPLLSICASLAEQLGIPVSQILSKTRTTQQQKELKTLVQKEANVRGAFRVTEAVNGRVVLVVDDLYDSGATMREVFRQLKSKGAKRIYVLSITRTIHTDA